MSHVHAEVGKNIKSVVVEMHKKIEVPGYLFSGIHAGFKKEDQKDLGLILSNQPATAAGCFTTNRVKAVPVILSQQRLTRQSFIRAILVNSGYANACTGEKGFKVAREACNIVSHNLGIKEEEILVASTGVIGPTPPISPFRDGIPKLCGCLSPYAAVDFAYAIMTTDKYPKISFLREGTKWGPLYLLGIAKGAGMIHPQMATMLAFVLTNIAIVPDIMGILLQNAVRRSFNKISIDGDTSTNDTVFMLANGEGDLPPIDGWNSKLLQTFQVLLDSCLKDLSKQIVSDGEGATKVIRIVINGARSQKEARETLRAIAHSLLVKTAFFGEDPNWGRIMAVLGRSISELDPINVDIWVNDVLLVKNGVLNSVDTEKEAKAIMEKEEYEIKMDINMGPYKDEIWTTDLSTEYVKINAHYRT